MIATLDPEWQATRLVTPVVKWGTIGRSTPMGGTYHFYTDDYKFSALRTDARPVAASGCMVAVEPNFSTWPGQPIDRVLADVATKRRIARQWQSHGVRIVVDLNVEPEFRRANLEGVPDGWGAYAVRWQKGIDLDAVEADHEAASIRAGGEPSLFVVFGGGRLVRDLCGAKGWTWVPEHMHTAIGREKSYGQG